MVLTYRKATILDADLLIDIYPSDKEQNRKFYTEKCGFNIAGKGMDGNVEVADFILER